MFFLSILTDTLLVEATIDTRRGIAGQEDLWGFQLTFRVSLLARGEEEFVRVWVEPGGIQRTVQRHVLGRSDADTSITTKIDERHYPVEVGQRRLREFLYLWTCDVPADEQVRPPLRTKSLQPAKPAGLPPGSERALAGLCAGVYQGVRQKETC